MSVLPKQLKKYPEIDLKLGIKSSLPHPKATLALTIMLWEVSDGASTIHYSESIGNGQLAIDSVWQKKLIDRYSSTYNQSGVSDADFLQTINNNCLVKSQLEALVVALALVWRLAKVDFVENKPASSERTGKERFDKKLLYTKNIDVVHLLMKQDKDAFDRVLLNWIGLSSVSVDNRKELDFLNLLSNFSEEAVFKLQEKETGDIVFNQLGIYQAILEDGTPVDIKGDVEPKGALRILRSSLKEGLSSHFDYSDQNGVVPKAGLEDIIKSYSKRVDSYLSLCNSKHLRVAAEQPNASSRISQSETAKNVLLYGVPGSGKSHTIKQEYCDDYTHMEKVVFHPDYMNTDFVGQILPTVKEDGAITYEFTPGPFVRIMRKAFDAPTETFFLVIEEINRGNAPAIFGEIFQLLDRDITGKSTYAITNHMIADAVFGDTEEPVYIPSNLWILATMNTADQNVFTLDTAFQRRWNMRMIKNDISKAHHAETPILDTGITWKTFSNVINSQILTNNAVTLSSEDKRLGAYFIGDETLQPSSESDYLFFGEKVIKYLWDDAFKFNRDKVFDSRFTSLEEVIDQFNASSGFSRFNIFSPDVKDLLKQDSAVTEEP
ncbi:McrB family protein [Actinotignum urinale]|uniref:McrB family protein n=1 Tax=Actinotignum urinale TaxID=190146 RepID=UPI0003B6B7C7|nr:AAA family ATPase [Actinotignum urinale]MDY5159677.1 AAA family ATPase [Actinotignum urinale]